MEVLKEKMAGIATMNEMMPATTQRTNLAACVYAFFILYPFLKD